MVAAGRFEVCAAVAPAGSGLSRWSSPTSIVLVIPSQTAAAAVAPVRTSQPSGNVAEPVPCWACRFRGTPSANRFQTDVLQRLRGE